MILKNGEISRFLRLLFSKNFYYFILIISKLGCNNSTTVPELFFTRKISPLLALIITAKFKLTV